LGGSFVEPGAHFCSSGFAAVCPETPFSFSGGKTSPTGGVFIGYSIPWGSYIIGIEADIAARSAGTSSVQANTHAAAGGSTTEAFSGNLSQGGNGSVRARFGVPLGSMMIYATGGVAVGRVSGSFAYNASAAGTTLAPQPPTCVTIFDPNLDAFVTTCTPNPPFVVPVSLAGGGAQRWSETRVGSTMGAGIELALLDNIKFRLEWRYTNLGGFSQDVPLTVTAGSCAAPGCVATGNAHINMRASSQTLQFGIGFGM
jgi:opacity protein-like surface antigen